MGQNEDRKFLCFLLKCKHSPLLKQWAILHRTGTYCSFSWGVPLFNYLEGRNNVPHRLLTWGREVSGSVVCKCFQCVSLSVHCVSLVLQSLPIPVSGPPITFHLRYVKIDHTTTKRKSLSFFHMCVRMCGHETTHFSNMV